MISYSPILALQWTRSMWRPGLLVSHRLRLHLILAVLGARPQAVLGPARSLAKHCTYIPSGASLEIRRANPPHSRLVVLQGLLLTRLRFVNVRQILLDIAGTGLFAGTAYPTWEWLKAFYKQHCFDPYAGHENGSSSSSQARYKWHSRRPAIDASTVECHKICRMHSLARALQHARLLAEDVNGKFIHGFV